MERCGAPALWLAVACGFHSTKAGPPAAGGAGFTRKPQRSVIAWSVNDELLSAPDPMPLSSAATAVGAEAAGAVGVGGAVAAVQLLLG